MIHLRALAAVILICGMLAVLGLWSYFWQLVEHWAGVEGVGVCGALLPMIVASSYMLASNWRK